MVPAVWLEDQHLGHDSKHARDKLTHSGVAGSMGISIVSIVLDMWYTFRIRVIHPSVSSKLRT